MVNDRKAIQSQKSVAITPQASQQITCAPSGQSDLSVAIAALRSEMIQQLAELQCRLDSMRVTETQVAASTRTAESTKETENHVYAGGSSEDEKAQAKKKTVVFEKVKSSMKPATQAHTAQAQYGGYSTTDFEYEEVDNGSEESEDELFKPSARSKIVCLSQPTFKQLYYKTDDVFEWFVDFEKQAAASGWDRPTMARQAPTHFHGVANDVYNMLTNTDKKNYTAVKRHMLKKMRVPGESSDNIVAYYTAKQMGGESPTELANRIMKLVEKTPQLRMSQSAEDIAKQFVKASRPDIRQSIANLAKFPSIQEAVKCAERADTRRYDRGSETVNAIGRKVEFANNRPYSPRPRKPNVGETCLNCNSPEHLVLSCPRVDKNSQCAYCGSKGHHDAICPIKFCDERRAERRRELEGNANASGETMRSGGQQSHKHAE